MVKYLNETRRQLMPTTFPTGAEVMLIDQLRQNKFEPKYVGPYVVLRRTRQGNFVLQDAAGDLLDRHAPPDQLKLVSKQARESSTITPAYEVQEVLEHRGTEGNYEYLT